MVLVTSMSRQVQMIRERTQHCSGRNSTDMMCGYTELWQMGVGGDTVETVPW